MTLSLRQLSYFVALSEELNFGRAAARVHVSQPALSMQVKELEAALDVALVERLPREVRLTRAGREVAARARRILAEVGELEGAARRRALRGRINLGVIPTVAPYLLPATLPRLRSAGAAPELRVREAQTEALMRELDDGRLDAIVVAGAADSAVLVARPLFEDRFLLAGSTARLAALPSPEPLRPRTLDPDQILLLDEGHCLADQALEVCGLDRRQTRLDLGASSLSTLCGLVAEGFGMTFVPEIAVRAEAAATRDLAFRRFAAPEPARSITLVRRRASTDDGWFGDLAAALAEAGGDLVGLARQHHP